MSEQDKKMHEIGTEKILTMTNKVNLDAYMSEKQNTAQKPLTQF